MSISPPVAVKSEIAMHISGQKYKNLPALAWRAIMTKSSPCIDVAHGPAVAISDDFFFDGAWAGDFQAGDFNSTYSFGSGCKIQIKLLGSSNHRTLCNVFTIIEILSA